MSPTWRPSAGLEMLKARAYLLGRIREFFAAAGVMEVETPIASRAAASDPALNSLRTRWSGAEAGPQTLYLQTSPELPMKRLLAAGSGPIFQICKVFRDGERGSLHHPEFSLLEWYRPGLGYGALMTEVAELVRHALDRPELAVRRISYRELFRTHLGLDPMRADVAALRQAADGLPGCRDLDLDRDGWLDLLLTYRIEPALARDRLTFVYDYPPSQATLARIRRDAEPVAERFELYLGGMELANGFQELTDPGEQRRRFDADLQERSARGLDRLPLDEAFLAALEAGMPAAAGVALGLDRLLMVATGSTHIDQTLAFPVERA
ncbi:EF-P lysine aminoacylase EpmA [Candidatus Thiosymbion oneisti]|uniref:EF-P lysine aminoacylase EpmA n=1 Tax=Candidatus Thiosymbion oneisti TaxID=589554 RepID=UPI001060D8AA|nr:EF-P lysine aminoacylase EpmA [Candidatus Thiosymbion oneisti]